MRQILAYIWEREYLRGNGSAPRGQKVFAEKGCAGCHNDPASGAPHLGKRADGYSAITMIAVLWQHGPAMRFPIESAQPEDEEICPPV